MDNEQVIAAIMTAVCCFGCAALFYGLGVWALKSKKQWAFGLVSSWIRKE